MVSWDQTLVPWFEKILSVWIVNINRELMNNCYQYVLILSWSGVWLSILDLGSKMNSIMATSMKIEFKVQLLAMSELQYLYEFHKNIELQVALGNAKHHNHFNNVNHAKKFSS